MLSDINNIITLRLAFSLADWMCDKFSLTGEARETLLDEIRTTKPNANGFDITLSFPDIVAEIKCNISSRTYPKTSNSRLIVEPQSQEAIDERHVYVIFLK